MVRAHLALRASGGKPRDGDRAGVPRVARGAVANGVVGVWFAEGGALRAAAGDGRSSFQIGQRVGRPLHIARVVLFPEGDLLRSEPLFAHDRSPGRRGMTAANEFLVDLLVTCF